MSPGFESRVVITPKISDASDKVRSIPQKQRNCVFSNEANLTYFRYFEIYALRVWIVDEYEMKMNHYIAIASRTYSRKNCELECQSNLIYQTCGCVLYYMPRTSNETSICNRDDYDCYKTMIQAIELTENDTYSCNCLPGCFELSYSSEVSIASLGSDKFYTKNNIIKKFGTAFSR